MASTRLVCGAEWSAATLYDFGMFFDDDPDPDALSRRAGDAIVEHFHAIAREQIHPSITWLPHTSEVLYECVGEAPDWRAPDGPWLCDAGEIDARLCCARDEAIQHVARALCDEADEDN